MINTARQAANAKTDFILKAGFRKLVSLVTNNACIAQEESLIAYSVLLVRCGTIAYQVANHKRHLEFLLIQ